MEALKIQEENELGHHTSSQEKPNEELNKNQIPNPNQTKPKLAMKDLSKAERREIQERQRAEKSALKANPNSQNGSGVNNKGKPLVHHGGQTAGLNQSSKSNASPANTTNLRMDKPSNLQLFLHLEPPASLDSLTVAQRTNPQLHHSILRLAQLYAQFKIVGSNARCIAMLEAFKEVIRSYVPPPGTSLSRHLLSHLSPQISHLVHARPLSVSMGNAIRHLKGVISRIDVDVPDEKAKSLIYDRIDLFIRDRIIVADKVIQSHAIQKIKDGDVIMTYANSSVIQGVLLGAHQQGISFKVIIVDSRPVYEGKNLLKLLTKSGIDCTYLLITSIGSILRTVDLLLLGTHALLGNGAMYGRAGTAIVAMMCKNSGIPVVCCCETYKFSERVMLDSIVSNEISTPQTHLPPTSHYPSFDFQSSVPQPKPIENLKVQDLALLYDVSRPEDVTMVITEAGMIPVQSVPVLLRDYKPLLAE
ncbi:hypothetical protein DFH28DRAFT_964447 [Melampsora americana]|nr:hypothetical protein DFH28DRAFT_964447 [Melampsora americana]